MLKSTLLPISSQVALLTIVAYPDLEFHLRFLGGCMLVNLRDYSHTVPLS